MNKSLNCAEGVSQLSPELKNKLVALFSIDKKNEQLFQTLSSALPNSVNQLLSKIEEKENFSLFDDFLSFNQAQFFINLFNSSNSQSMSYNSIKASYGQEPGGIQRSTFFSPLLAAALFKQLQSLVRSNNYSNTCPESPLTDSPNFKINAPPEYNFVNINPVFRFVKYHTSHSLVPHYDKSIQVSPGIASTHTIILYLSDNKSGATRLIKEKFENKDFKDWNKNQIEQLKPSDIYQSVIPKSGRLFLFKHKLLHDSAPIIDEQKLILTTEVLSQIT